MPYFPGVDSSEILRHLWEGIQRAGVRGGGRPPMLPGRTDVGPGGAYGAAGMGPWTRPTPTPGPTPGPPPEKNPLVLPGPMTKDDLESGRAPGPMPGPGAGGQDQFSPLRAALGMDAPPPSTPGRQPLRFAWGEEAGLRDYVPGKTDVLSMKGAPEGRSGFLGATPADPSRSGGFVSGAPENIDPRTLLEMSTASGLRREMEDPLYREREAAEIELSAQERLEQARERRQREEFESVRQEVEGILRASIEAAMKAQNVKTPDELRDPTAADLFDQAIQSVTLRTAGFGGQSSGSVMPY